jgi:hypothetical protein
VISEVLDETGVPEGDITDELVIVVSIVNVEL